MSKNVNEAGGGQRVVTASIRDPRPPKGKQISNLAELIIQRGLSHGLPGLTKELQEKVIKYHQKGAWSEGWYKKGANWLARIHYGFLQVGCALRSAYAYITKEPVTLDEFKLTIEEAKICLAAAQGNPEEERFLTDYITMKNSQAFAVVADTFTPEKIQEDPERFIAFEKDGLNEAAESIWQAKQEEAVRQPQVDFDKAQAALKEGIDTLNIDVQKKKHEITVLKRDTAEVSNQLVHLAASPSLSANRAKLKMLEEDKALAEKFAHTVKRLKDDISREESTIRSLGSDLKYMQTERLQTLRAEEDEAKATHEIAPLLSDYVVTFAKLQKIQGKTDEEIKQLLRGQAQSLGSSGSTPWQGDKKFTTLMDEAIARM